MIETLKVLAVITARSGSKGLPGKNLLSMHGRPLVAYPILAARNSVVVDLVYCSTDSDDIAKCASFYGADVSYRRPEALSQDHVPSVDVVKDTLDYFQSVGKLFEYVIVLEPTSPLTVSEDIDEALKSLHLCREDFDSVVSIAESVSGHPHFTFSREDNGRIVPHGQSPWRFLRRQELPSLYFQTGSFYISKVSTLLSNNSFITERTLGILVSKLKSYEIDDIIDFWIIERLMSVTKRGGIEVNHVS